jgi:hypothetical protein
LLQKKRFPFTYISSFLLRSISPTRAKKFWENAATVPAPRRCAERSPALSRRTDRVETPFLKNSNGPPRRRRPFGRSTPPGGARAAFSRIPRDWENWKRIVSFRQLTIATVQSLIADPEKNKKQSLPNYPN